MSENFKIRLNEIKDEQTGDIIEANFRYDDVSTDHDRYIVLLLRNVLMEKGIDIDVSECIAQNETISGVIRPVYKPRNWRKFKRFIKKKWPKLELKFRKKLGE